MTIVLAICFSNPSKNAEIYTILQFFSSFFKTFFPFLIFGALSVKEPPLDLIFYCIIPSGNAMVFEHFNEFLQFFDNSSNFFRNLLSYVLLDPCAKKNHFCGSDEKLLKNFCRPWNSFNLFNLTNFSTFDKFCNFCHFFL